MTTLTIGRRSDCHIVVNDPTVSRLHAEIAAADGGRFTLRDMESAGGTFVRDGQIWRRVTKTTVSIRDVLRLGSHEVSVAELLARIPDMGHQAELPAQRLAPAARISDKKARFERDPVTGQIVEKP
jgi:pSer/pThr/pTyr-binding forkhead associated (FHA) protein